MTGDLQSYNLFSMFDLFLYSLTSFFCAESIHYSTSNEFVQHTRKLAYLVEQLTHLLDTS